MSAPNFTEITSLNPEGGRTEKLFFVGLTPCRSIRARDPNSL